MSTYKVVKTYGHDNGFSCAFRQWSAESHCSYIHGYSLGFTVTIGSDKLDVNKGYKLPHLVEVATTLKFIEQRNNTEDRTKLYSFKSLTYGN